MTAAGEPARAFLTMQVTINGEARDLAEGTTIESLIALLGFAGRRLAVEVNDELVARSRHPQHALKDGDRIEIVHAIGGG